MAGNENAIPASNAAARLDLAAAGRLLGLLDESLGNGEGDAVPVRGVPPGYRVDRIAGRGGGGVVYRVFREGSERALALKVLSIPLGDPEHSRAAQRAWRELALLEDLHLPCLPRVVDYGTHDGRLFIVTDWIDGRALDKHCEAAALDRRARVGLLAEVADAVQMLHEHGVIHRDLKPSNILIDSHGRPMIVDFGLAALAAEGMDPAQTLSVEGSPLGTPAFMSPEQARGEKTGEGVTTRSDVYSLGATGYVVLTGKTPHDMEVSLHEGIRRVAMEEARPARLLDPTLPRALGAVLGKACARESGGRYGSARELGEDLRRFVRGEGIEAATAAPVRIAIRFIRRHPVLTTALLCVAMIAASIMFAAMLVRLQYGTPAMVELDRPTRAARVLSRAGGVLHHWVFDPDDPTQTAVIRSRHPELGGGRIVATLLNEPGRAREERQLRVYELNKLHTPAWTTSATLEVPPGREPSGPAPYGVQFFLFADVFTSPETPGEEIVVVHGTASAAWSICVYDMRGNRLFEAWHDGVILSGTWLPQARLLICAADRHGTGLESASLAGPGIDYPKVVLALQPQTRSGVTWGWITDPANTVASAVLRWTRWVAPRDVGIRASVRVVGTRRLAATGAEGAEVEFRVDSRSAASWLIDGDGNAILDGAVPDGFRVAHPQLAHWLMSGDVHLATKPPTR